MWAIRGCLCINQSASTREREAASGECVGCATTRDPSEVLHDSRAGVIYDTFQPEKEPEDANLEQLTQDPGRTLGTSAQ